MHIRSTTTRAAVVIGCLAALGATSGATAAGRTHSADLPGDAAVAFWPHETGALVGTSETYIDVRADGSYFDPSVGRRVLAAR